MTPIITRGLALIALLCSAAGAQTKQILFLAGPRDHGVAGRHEYEKDLRALASALETSSNVSGVTTRVVVGRAPSDLSEYANVSAIVIESSSDRAANEVHPLFPPDPTTNHSGYDSSTTAFLKGLDALIKQKHIGIVVFHYANWVENWAARGLYYDWLGGLWVQMVSKNPNDDWSMALENGSHPVLRGVKPFTYRDEVFSRFFLPDDPRRTDLLIGTPKRATIGPQVAAWAYERADGGRGFVFGGMDYHDNLALDDFRKLLVNGIAWAAGIEIPSGGVATTAPKE
jgi:hypothetical protein